MVQLFRLDVQGCSIFFSAGSAVSNGSVSVPETNVEPENNHFFGASPVARIGRIQVHLGMGGTLGLLQFPLSLRD